MACKNRQPGSGASIRFMEESARLPKSDFFLHTVDPSGARVVMSYCPRCGKFVAASPDPRIIAIAEAIHDCAK